MQYLLSQQKNFSGIDCKDNNEEEEIISLNDRIKKTSIYVSNVSNSQSAYWSQR